MTIDQKIYSYGTARAELALATNDIAEHWGRTTEDEQQRLVEKQSAAIVEVNLRWDDLKRTIESYDTKIF